MFTGIVQGTGIVRRSYVIGIDLKLVVGLGNLAEKGIVSGDSIAVDGVCLTVTSRTGSDCCFDVSQETLQRTLLGARIAEDEVNLELAMLPTSRLGGHFVTGHIDGVGRLESLQPAGLSNRMRFSAPPELSRFIAEKGSICIDGVSLTVNAVSGNKFEVNIVPHTLQVTTMQRYLVGRKVHLEVDIIARYLDRLMVGSGRTQIDPGASADDDGRAEQEDTEERITGDLLSKKGFLAPDIGE